MEQKNTRGLVKMILTGATSAAVTIIPLISGCAASDPYYSNQYNPNVNQQQSAGDYLGTTNPRNQANAGALFQHWGEGNHPNFTPGESAAFGLMGKALSAQAQINAVNQARDQQLRAIEQLKQQGLTGGQGTTIIIQESPYKFRDENNIESIIMTGNKIMDLNRNGKIDLFNGELTGIKHEFATGEDMFIVYSLKNLPRANGNIRIDIISPTRRPITSLYEINRGLSHESMIYQQDKSRFLTLSAGFYNTRGGGYGTYTANIYWEDHLVGSHIFKLVGGAP